MCPAIQQMREQSMAEGEVKGRMKAYAEMVESGMIDLSLAASQLGMTAEEFLQETGITIPKS